MWYFTPGQVLGAAAADEHDRVLLQVVALARDVGDDLVAVRQAHLGDLAERRVRLLRRRRVDARADAAALRVALERDGPGGLALGRAALADELVDRRHSGAVGSVRSAHDGGPARESRSPNVPSPSTRPNAETFTNERPDPPFRPAVREACVEIDLQYRSIDRDTLARHGARLWASTRRPTAQTRRHGPLLRGRCKHPAAIQGVATDGRRSPRPIPSWRMAVSRREPRRPTPGRALSPRTGQRPRLRWAPATDRPRRPASKARGVPPLRRRTRVPRPTIRRPTHTFAKSARARCPP